MDATRSRKRRSIAPQIERRTIPWQLLLTLAAVTLIAYQPAWNGGWLWDDDAHVTRAALRSLDGLRRIWFEVGATQQYYPLVHSVFWLEHALWGDGTLGYHLVSICLHALSAFLLFLVLRRLECPGAALAAAIFALHPVHVESVAWITELKNTLSGALYLGSGLAYLEFDATRRKSAYALSLGLFVGAVLSKTVAASLPATLIVTFWWKRGRLNTKADVTPLAPFFAIGLLGGLTTAWIERTLIGAEGNDFQFTLIERCLIAGRAVWFYLGKLVWPVDLTFVYSRWDVSQDVWWQYLFPVAAVALAVALWRVRGRSRAPLAAMVCFGVSLFPALGFFNVYPFRFSFVADHFQYLASLPIIALFAGAAAKLPAGRWQAARKPVAFGIVAILGILTWNQSRLYADSETLYRATIENNPFCWMAYDNLGRLKLEGAGSPADVEQAADYFRQSLAIRSTNALAHHNLGLALKRLGRLQEARAAFEEAARLEPTLAQIHSNMATVLLDLNQIGEALAESREAVRLNPRLVEAQNMLGTALQRSGRVEEAIAPIQEALRLDPRSADAHVNLGNAFGRLQRFDESIDEDRLALAIDGRSWRAHANLGLVLLQAGRPNESVSELREALRLEPDAAGLRESLTAALEVLAQLRPS